MISNPDRRLRLRITQQLANALCKDDSKTMLYYDSLPVLMNSRKDALLDKSVEAPLAGHHRVGPPLFAEPLTVHTVLDQLRHRDASVLGLNPRAQLDSPAILQ